MLIGIDGRSLGPMKTGIGVYLSEILKHEPFSSNTTNIHLFSHQPIASSPSGRPSLHVTKTAYGLPWYLFRSHRSIHRFQLDLFWGVQGLLPVNLSKALPAVITIHDCVHQAGLGYAPSTIYNLAHRYFIPKAIQRSCRILTVSNFVADEILHHYHVPAARLEVIPLGVSTRFSPNIETTKIEEILAVYRIEAPFVLWVGTLEPRKNLRKLLQAFALLPSELKKRLQLVLVGKSGWGKREVFSLLRAMPQDCRIRLPGYVTEEHLPYIYGAAELFVFPSLYEGFGLPVLEAMAAGCPVIASNASSLKEVTGSSAITLDPSSPDEEWSESIARVSLSPDLRSQLRASGLLQAQRFRWEDCAHSSYEVLSAIAK